MSDWVKAVLNNAPRWWIRGLHRLARSGVAERDVWTWEEFGLYLALWIAAQGHLYEMVLKEFEDELDEARELRARTRDEADRLDVDPDALRALSSDRWYPDWKAKDRAWLSRAQWEERSDK